MMSIRPVSTPKPAPKPAKAEAAPKADAPAPKENSFTKAVEYSKDAAANAAAALADKPVTTARPIIQKAEPLVKPAAKPSFG